MAIVRQTNFGAGELDPLLHGRTDLELFLRGLKTCRNFFITRAGAASSRPGSTFVREGKYGVTNVVNALDPDGFDSGRVRLIPYVYSDGRTFVIELGHAYLRLHTLGRTVMSGAVPYEVATPWLSFALPYLRYAQSGAVMTITLGGPHQVNAANGAVPVELTIRVHPTTGVPSVEIVGLDQRPLLSGMTSTKPLSPPDPLFADIDNPANVTTNFALVIGSVGVIDTTHPVQEWQWLFTAIIQDEKTGATYETKGARVTRKWDGADYPGTGADITSDNWPVYSDRAITLRRAADPAGDPPPWKVLAYFAYRGRGGVYGFVGSTTTREFIDVGKEPDLAKQPPLGTDPFRILKRDGTLHRIESPLAVGFFESRRIWGGTDGGVEGEPPVSGGSSPIGTRYGRPTSLLCSSNADYYDHDKRLAAHVSGEALEYALAALKREEVRHLVTRERFVVLTDSQVWTFGGTANEPLDFDSVNAHATDHVGSGHVAPLVVDDLILFVRNKGFGARALLPTGPSSDRPYVGRDVAEQAKHLFVGPGSSKAIRDWCYAEDPWGIVWAVRGDGAMLSFTPTGEQSIAWARHDTDGTYESICSVPEGEEDAVYAVVKRIINGAPKRYIERLTSRVRRVVESANPPLYLAEPAADDTDQLYPTDVCLDCAFTYAGPPALALDPAGLAALNHKEVYVLAKGLPVLGPFRVQGTPALIDLTAPLAQGQGLEDLPAANAVDDGGNPIFVARIGLKYTCDLETLAIRGSPTMQQKTLREVGFELDNSKGIRAGQDFDHLGEWEQREVSDSFSPISAANTLLVTTVDNTWDKNARCVLRQDEPLPVTVVGIMRDLVADDG